MPATVMRPTATPLEMWRVAYAAIYREMLAIKDHAEARSVAPACRMACPVSRREKWRIRSPTSSYIRNGDGIGKGSPMDRRPSISNLDRQRQLASSRTTNLPTWPAAARDMMARSITNLEARRGRGTETVAQMGQVNVECTVSNDINKTTSCPPGIQETER